MKGTKTVTSPATVNGSKAAKDTEAVAGAKTVNFTHTLKDTETVQGTKAAGNLAAAQPPIKNSTIHHNTPPPRHQGQWQG